MQYLLAFVLAFVMTSALTPVARRFALQFDVVDNPGGRKVHQKPTPYLGGLAIFASFVVSAFIFLPVSRQMLSLLVAGLILVVVGAVDDAKDLSAGVKLFWQFIAAGVALSGGIGITTITNPFGGVLDLTWGRFAVNIRGLSFHVTPVANALSLLWMVGLANTVNFLDGLDGLASGVSGIAAVVIFLLSLGQGVNQPLVAMLSIVLAGSALGFLPMNFNPAKIFMGDSGAYFLGLTLAMLSIYSGGKLATALLVLGLPVFDAVWAVVRRLAQKRSPFSADKGHIYHLLLGAGFSQREVALALYVFAAVFGLTAIYASSVGKFVALAAMFATLALLVAILTVASLRRSKAR